MRQQHHDIDLKTYEKGINSDMNKEILGSREGEHVDALNMRSISMDGDNFAKKKIKGEELLYDAIDNRCFLEVPGILSEGYECMMSQEINGHIVEIWASSTPDKNPPFIRVNGKVVLMSEFFPVTINTPLQYDKNESCVGGEFYVTNNTTPPMVFSLKDLMENGGMTDVYPNAECTQKYFDEFNLEQYVIDIASPLYKPMFINQDPSTTAYSYSAILGSLGLPVGSYSYSYRYVTQEGDRGRWSPVTELIPVTRSVGSADAIFPNRRTYSDTPNVASPSGYGNHIRIRIENYSDFDFIEIRRDCWYTGELIGLPSISELVGFVDVQQGLSVIDVLDRCASNEVEEILTFEDTEIQMTGIERSKSIRYFNERLYLMNIGYASRDIDADVDFVPGTDLIFPAIHKMGKSGHKSPYNSTHYKSNMRGEKVGFGIMLFDKDGNYSYVKQIPGAENFKFPERRTPTSFLTQGISYNGTVRAALENPLNGSKVASTHEVFDHENASGREGEVFANIFNGTNFLNANQPWAPFNPTGQSDSTSDYGFNVNTEVRTSGDAINGEWKNYNPRGFGLNYYSMGAAFKGIDTSTLPSWATAFSIVQTPPANRVIAQGLGWYAMVQAEKTDFTSDWFGAQSGKETNKLWVYLPDGDVDSGGVKPQLIDDLLQNYSNGVFKLQAVSPLGYFSEVYAFNNEIAKDEQADIITYVRVLHDEGQINPTMTATYDTAQPQGIISSSKQYVGYGNFRAQVPPAVYANNSNGDHLFTITNVQEQTIINGRGNYLIITLDSPIYTKPYGQTYINEFRQEVRQWQEPMYVINIIREEANITDSNITSYNYVGHYQRLKSLIGEGTGLPLDLKLVSERWEDCIPVAPNQVTSGYSSFYRFLWIEDAQLVPRKWLNAYSLTASQINTVLNDLQANGVATVSDASGPHQIYGLYKHQYSPVFQHYDANILFGAINGVSNEYTIPPAGAKIYVYYDNRIPIRVFGGDTYINESVWAPVDTEYGSNAKPINQANEFRWNMAMPYNKFKLSTEIYILKDGSGIIDHIQFDLFGRGREVFNFDVTEPAIVRQWVTMWTAETRTNLSFAYNIETGADKNSNLQYFPLKNYVMRPNKWTTSNNFQYPDVLNDNKIYLEYYDVYGDEHLNWQWGGFRFKPQTNIDYAKTQTNIKPSSVPQFGFEEQTEYCTRILWSERRPINVQNTPTVKTFPSNNFYDISDDTGCINFAWSAISDSKGNNLYAITQGGICLLLVDKRIIHEINANELATVGSDIGGILNELWLNRSTGMSDETWRSWSEYSNMLFFANTKSVYSLIDNQLSDLGSNGFLEVFTRKFLEILGPGFSSRLSGGFNVLTKEYIMNVSNNSNKDEQFSTLIYGTQQEALQCQSSYSYDKYLYISNSLFGTKNAKTFTLGVGNQINGEDMECYLTGVSDKQIYFDKEFIRIRVNSNSKPDKIYFYDSYQDYIDGISSSVVDATINPISIKDYFGYECYIPRKSMPPHYRQQGRVVLFRITSSEDEDFLITSTGVQYKQLK
jgi:hypothetical protein